MNEINQMNAQMQWCHTSKPEGKMVKSYFFFLEVDLFFLNLRHLFRDVLYCYNRIPQTEQFTMNRNLLADGSGGRED